MSKEQREFFDLDAAVGLIICSGAAIADRSS